MFDHLGEHTGRPIVRTAQIRFRALMIKGNNIPRCAIHDQGFAIVIAQEETRFRSNRTGAFVKRAKYVRSILPASIRQ